MHADLSSTLCLDPIKLTYEQLKIVKNWESIYGVEQLTCDATIALREKDNDTGFMWSLSYE